MKEFMKKHETIFVIALIVVYLVSNSISMQAFGTADHRHLVVNVLLVAGLLFAIVKFDLASYCGLTSFPAWKPYLYFLPLLLLISANLWGGVTLQNTPSEIIFYMLSMLCVGFLEEIIFRGFLFKMMEKSNVTAAIAVSSLTFGVGHIVNLFNGAELFPTLLQIAYATSIGFLFAIIFYKSKSLYPCILTHGIFNALSVFHTENAVSTYVTPVVLILLPLAYALYIHFFIKTPDKSPQT